MLTKTGVRISREALAELKNNLQEFDKIHQIARSMEADQDFAIFASGTELGTETMSKWKELANIITELKELLNSMSQATDTYLDNQSRYSDNLIGRTNAAGWPVK